MKFLIYRTSGLIPPCTEAIKEDDGEYHIEINNLDELMDFIKWYGTIVLSKDEIEIYDFHRE